jgi:hypothetical protein
MTTELTAGKQPQAASQAQADTSLNQPEGVGPVAPLIKRGNVPAEASAAMALTAHEKNQAAIKRLKGYKFDKYALRTQTARLRKGLDRTERLRTAGYRSKRP